jgi:hypothetical protein
MVVALIALFVALSGSGYAALSGKDKKQVRKIANQEIAAKAGGLSVANANALDGLDSADFRRSNQVIGATALGTIRERSSQEVTVAPGQTEFATANCLEGEQFLSGGNDFGAPSMDADLAVTASRFHAPNGWRVFLRNSAASGNALVIAHVYCLEP